MRLQDFIFGQVPNTEQFRRARDLDIERLDYLVKVRHPSGNEYCIREPKDEPDGTFQAKEHSIVPGSELLALGTAFLDYQNGVVQVIGIDVDAKDHDAGHDDQTLEEVVEALSDLPYVEIRRSTGGMGLHLFVHFADDVPVQSRKEESLLGSAAVNVICNASGYDLSAVVDYAGCSMWLYRQGSPPNAFDVLKEATGTLDVDELPADWRESKPTRKATKKSDDGEVPLSDAHLEMMDHQRQLGYPAGYVPEHGCVRLHTHGLKLAHEQHGYRGYFETVSEGSDPSTPNCFGYSLSDGGWYIQRYNRAKEHSSWYIGQNGQYNYLNVHVPFKRALGQFATNKTTKGYAFTCEKLNELLQATGVDMAVPDTFCGRTIFTKWSQNNPHEACLVVDRGPTDQTPDGWTATDETWQCSFAVPEPSAAFHEGDRFRISNIVRAASTDTESTLWFVNANADEKDADDYWLATKSGEVGHVLGNYVFNASATMGRMRLNAYHLVHEPFQPEYLSGRRWNRKAAQLACTPAETPGETPTWDAVFEHIGSGLDDDVAADDDCRARGITSGAMYLMLWIKILIENTKQRLPYLFLYSKQNNTGKSSFGMSIRKLIDPGVGVITEESICDKFNGELEGKVLCLIEEIDLQKGHGQAYTTIKNLTTAKTLTIRRMQTDAYTVANYTHFIHTTNNASYVPCDGEDMRIVMIEVSPIANMIEDAEFEQRLEEEAPSMLRKLFDMPLPDPCGRLWLPILQTSFKESVLAKVHDQQLTPAEEGLLAFADAWLHRDDEAEAPIADVLACYDDFCRREGIEKLHKATFLPKLHDLKWKAVGKTQRRVDGKGTRFYTGIGLLSERRSALCSDDRPTVRPKAGLEEHECNPTLAV